VGSESPIVYRGRLGLGDKSLPQELFSGIKTPNRIIRQESAPLGICDQPHLETDESTEFTSEIVDIDPYNSKNLHEVSQHQPATKPVIFRLRRSNDLREVTMVASWSGWREHIVLFHRNRYGYDSIGESQNDDASASCVEVYLPNGTHHFKVSKRGLHYLLQETREEEAPYARCSALHYLR
jgi:hypothetical protein